RDHLEAEGLHLSLRAVAQLAQEQEPGQRGGAARGDGGLERVTGRSSCSACSGDRAVRVCALTALNGYATFPPGTPQAVFLEPEPHTTRAENSSWRARE